MRKIYLLLVIAVAVASIIVACGEVATKECNITTKEQQRQGKIVTAQFDINADCEEMRKLAEQGQPLPTYGSAVTKDAPAETPPPKPIDVTDTPTVPGVTDAALIPITNKAERQQQLSQNLPKATEKRDPFSPIKGEIPALPQLKPIKVEVPPTTPGSVEVTPPSPPPPPDTTAAQALGIAGVFRIGNSDFLIIQAPGSLGYVRVGDQIPGTPVTVKSISGTPEKLMVTLEQNGVEVTREVLLVPAFTEEKKGQTST
ncbi:MAG: hypothetical protein ACK4QL_10460 [Pseudanabaenaceae cyanobacterium]